MSGCGKSIVTSSDNDGAGSTSYVDSPHFTDIGRVTARYRTAPGRSAIPAPR